MVWFNLEQLSMQIINNATLFYKLQLRDIYILLFSSFQVNKVKMLMTSEISLGLVALLFTFAILRIENCLIPYDPGWTQTIIKITKKAKEVQ